MLYAIFCQSDNTHFVAHVIINCNQNVREKYKKVMKYERESPSRCEVAKEIREGAFRPPPPPPGLVS